MYAEFDTNWKKKIIILNFRRTVKPAYKCDDWNSKHRICILERNIGDTVTFYLSTGHHAHKPNVTWKQEFHLRNSADKKEFIIQPGKNMAVYTITKVEKLKFDYRIS